MMAKFRKKPVVIDAIQWYPGMEIDEVDESAACQDAHGIRCDQAWVKTLEGGHVISFGDWLITGDMGEKYPCQDAIFKLTYDPVDE